MRQRHLPELGLVGRLVAILLLTLLVEFAVSTVLYERASQFSVRDDEARRLAEHLVIARRLVGEVPALRRPAMAEELTTDRYFVRWAQDLPPLPIGSATPDRVENQVLTWEPTLAKTGLRLTLIDPGDRSVIAGALRLDDGSWLYFRTLEPIRSSGFPFQRVLSTLLPALVLMLMGVLLIRQTLLPIRTLTRAVERLGPSLERGVPPVAVDGTGEVRHLIQAFNSMQARIARLIDERTRALAAVGHDLRTPLARLRLRGDAIDDRTLRDEIGSDIDGMEAMITSLLAFLGGEGEPEQPRRIDLAVLCASVVDDAVDHGHAVTYAGPAHLETVLRASGFRRAIVNLVDNAVRYGQQVVVTLDGSGRGIELCVEDDGPGIPADALALVREPFVRLDDARRRDTSGFGLGLSIVAQAVAAEGGQLDLSNRPEGGLCARITLPQQ